MIVLLIELSFLDFTGVLIEHFILKILRLGPQILQPKRLSINPSSLLDGMQSSLLLQQATVLSEVKTWFSSEPKDIVELFLNFDKVDANSSQSHLRLLPSTHWKITQQLCDTICTLTEQCTFILSKQIRSTRIDLVGVDIGASETGVHNAPNVQMTEEDLQEMGRVRDGARFLQEKCFAAIGQMVRSLMLCAAATTGANYNLLKTLKEKKEAPRYISSLLEKEGGSGVGSSCYDDDDSASSGSSYDNMTVKSLSTIGNIVGGLKKIPGTDLQYISEHLESPSSPLRPDYYSDPSSPLKSVSNNSGIVEYWQTSIAPERRKNLNFSPSERGKIGTQDLSIGLPKMQRSKINTSMHDFVPTSISPMRNPNCVASVSTCSVMNHVQTNGITKKNEHASDVFLTSEAIPVMDETITDYQVNEKVENILNVSFDIMKSKSLKKALDYLIACNYLTSSPHDIASFLRLHQAQFDSAVLGEYLGEGGRDSDDLEHFNLIRFNYARAISFVDMNVEQG